MVLMLMTGLAACGHSWMARAFPAGNASPVAQTNAPGGAPVPLADHPGNIFLLKELVRIHAPTNIPPVAVPWTALNEAGGVVSTGTVPALSASGGTTRWIDLGRPAVGWYRVEVRSAGGDLLAWTTAAVLAPLGHRADANSPIAVDSATSWFARNDVGHQEKLANLAALAGVAWVRDRMRWGEMEPKQGSFAPGGTTYDTAAEIQHRQGLHVLQVFHDAPAWAADPEVGGGHFSPDLRHVYRFARAMADRFSPTVQSWEPWNEANIETFGGHTVDEMCSWQKAAFLGFKSAKPSVLVGWNVSAAIPTPQQTLGILSNETWAYYDTYNIHTYDWAHGYADLWAPAREAACGRPLWITESDRGTPHLNNPPWYDQAPQLERLKAEYIAQSYACSLFAGSTRHFQFVLGNYQEPNGVQFGLLRLDLTPRPGYVALAAVGRFLNGAKALGRLQPGHDLQIYAFQARPDGHSKDVLVLWTEREVDWGDRGKASATWELPANMQPVAVYDHLGRTLGRNPPSRIGSAPIYILLPPGGARGLALQPPPAMPPAPHAVEPSQVVLQALVPAARRVKVIDLAWSEGYAYRLEPGQTFEVPLAAYNFNPHDRVSGVMEVASAPRGWEVSLDQPALDLPPMERATLRATLKVGGAPGDPTDGWVVLKARCGPAGAPVLAFRCLVPKPGAAPK